MAEFLRLGASEHTRPLTVYENLSPDKLILQSVIKERGQIGRGGVLLINTRPDTGRFPQGKFVVSGRSTLDVNFGDMNQSMKQEVANELLIRATSHLESKGELFTQNLLLRRDIDRTLAVKLITESPSAALFARNLFLPAPEGEPYTPEYTIVHAPTMKANVIRINEKGEEENLTKAIVLDFAKGLNIIAGTRYQGEIKKAMFNVLQYILPSEGIATMHCSTNMDENGKTNVFFGLSGTGKTTLSTDPTRILIGDDEHGWSNKGIFNFEGGSYAKVADLSKDAEPLIFDAVGKQGAVLENVSLGIDGYPVFQGAIDNSRGAFPLDFVPSASKEGVGNHPKNIIFLTADASGVLPPVAKLSIDQAMYHFLSGYTSKIPGTEADVEVPEPTFSACFGSPFLPLPAERYAELLEEKIRQHNPSLWLVNTGWPGGYENGQRMSIEYTRKIINAIQNDEVEGEDQDSLGFVVPMGIKDVPPDALRAEYYWDSKDEYDRRAKQLAQDFEKNISKFNISDEIRSAGPRYIEAA